MENKSKKYVEARLERLNTELGMIQEKLDWMKVPIMKKSTLGGYIEVGFKYKGGKALLEKRAKYQRKIRRLEAKRTALALV